MIARSAPGVRTRIRSLAALFLLVGTLVPVAVLAPQHGASAAEGDVPVTKNGSGRFSDVAVTVSQVAHMRNQVVRISWTGAKQSSTSGANFLNNYMQIMQCWGDEAEPQREKCQYGGIFGDQRGGQATSNREVVNNGELDDPNEIPAYKGKFPSNGVVPFESVTGKTVTDRRNEFFDTQSTNEIDYGRTSSDGTGEEFFEVQTGREAAGLGCGAAESDGSTRDCWLVVVPRDTKEVNGQDVSDFPSNRLETSPLAASNFANAISFRLDFDPIAVTCPLGDERRMLGNEEASEAVARWQPVLCGATGSIFGYSTLGDDLARRQTLSDKPWLSLVNRPIQPSANVDGRLLTYAPVSISAVGVGVVIERYPKDSASDAVKAKRGTRVLDLKLNARLVAKLLTQTYTAAVLGNTSADKAHVAGNPARLTDDKEFLELNPEFKDLQYTDDFYEITNPLGLSDANREVWKWIQSDPDAKAFINGKADPWGTKVNPYYKGMDLDRQDFPRSDPGCASIPDGRALLCSLDHLAYAPDFHTAARGAIRGLTLANDNWDWGPPARYKQNPAQPPGQRAVLALMDTATAARFQVTMARLKNASGAFVTPTEDAMDTAVGAMTNSSVPGVLESNPGTKRRTAYPMTQVTYAVTAPRQLSADEAKAYSRFVTYVTGAGQTPGLAPGQLPEGYLPLTDELRAQARAAAALIAKRGGPLPSADSDGTDDGSDAAGDSGDTPVASAPVEGTVPAGTAPVTSVPPSSIVPASSTTPATETGVTRFVLLGAALLGLLAALTRPALVVTGAYRRWRASTPPESPR